MLKPVPIGKIFTLDPNGGLGVVQDKVGKIHFKG
jgi:hypothetical protein